MHEEGGHRFLWCCVTAQKLACKDCKHFQWVDGKSSICWDIVIAPLKLAEGDFFFSLLGFNEMMAKLIFSDRPTSHWQNMDKETLFRTLNETKLNNAVQSLLLMQFYRKLQISKHIRFQH